MVDSLADALNLETWQSQLVITGALIVVLTGLRLVVLGLVRRRIEDATVWYRARKLTSYVVTVVGLVVLATVWVRGSGFVTYIGFLSAGLAIAFADVLKNLAGWGYIVLRRPFRLGDRIELNGDAGDVVDIRALRFTVLEIAGERVAADQSTGRLLHIPNGLLFNHALANYTEAFGYLWHEIPVLVTFESDWERAEEIMTEVLTAHAPDMAAGEVARELRASASAYQIRYSTLTPTTYVTVKDSGVLVTGRLLVPARRLRGTEADIWKAILRAFEAEPSVELAYPTVRTFFHDPIRVENP
ncbi:MAG: mechanosensitive ion channel [Acidimicrobiia bacterium]|nr:mechanosensitive ion channel [Acidimicrobiia bacterium]